MSRVLKDNEKKKCHALMISSILLTIAEQKVNFLRQHTKAEFAEEGTREQISFPGHFC